MPGLLRPFVNRVGIGPKQVPTGPVVIDWSHPLANGLVGAFVPGAMGIVDLVGNIQNVSIGNPTVGMTPEGSGMFSQASSPAPNIPGVNATASSIFKTPTAFSLYYRGFVNASNASAFNNIMGVSYDNANTSPFNIWTMASNNVNLESGIALYWNQGGTNTNLSGAATVAPWVVNTIVSNCGTFKVGGNTTLYSAGAQASQTTFGAGSPTSTATAQIMLNCGNASGTSANTTATCLCGYYWNRELSAAEVAWIDQYPYDFLIPAESEMPVARLPASSVVFRKSLSPVGTRTGSRQGIQ